ncbi:Protein of unknown function [Dyella jiangningensis]|uniref:DUF3300 domain-containing protein n=1 Tax=Dyella sp. AtDHG13 TaxID=1938897 RepID=UPI00088991F4|nr:DUF3300 domain-containing protein [Dyella sp. AtDHG13]PXV60588.1 uncharacterized protein DUF3300 [Dyella sp. AtDHG13]SDJ51364.1 Protein of unknown function [Dyella jiangningensis]
MKMARYGEFWRICLVCLLCVPLLLVGPVAAQGQQGSTQKIYNNQQLDQMLAPVALYPDALLSQVLMACTYPSNVADAAAWSAAHPKAQGDDAVKQVANQPWDPSVQSLVAFPQVLAQMKQQPDWVQNVGDAFLAQPDDVMASVQRLRAQAQKAGNLKSTDQQKVVVQQAPASAPSTTVIQIEPANPQVVYVPTYNPTVVYGTWAYPSYPPTYWPPPPGYAYPVASGLAAGLAFGTGIAIANSLWGGFDWGHNDVNINVNRYNNINVNNRISGNGNVNWNHNPDYRRGTPYRDQASRQRYGQGVGGASQRQAFRGNDAAANANRERALQSFDRSTNNGSSMAARRSAGETGAALNRPAAGNRAGGAERGNIGGQARGGNIGGETRGNFAGNRSNAGPRNNAFSGVQSPGSARTQFDRGQASQRSMSSFHGAGAGAGRQVSRPAPSRGAGGFHRR